MAKALTSASVSRLRGVEDGVREIPDGGAKGLYLLIFPSGRKSWALRYRRPEDGRPAKLTLGTVFDTADGREVDVKPVIGGHLSLRSAHVLVAELKHEIALGRDPGQAHLAKKRQIISSDKFGGAALDFVEQHAKRKTRRWNDTARILGLEPKPDGDGFVTIRKGLCDRWKDKSVTDIDGDLIHAIIEETREKGIPGLARRRKEPSESRARSMFATLSMMFTWLIQKRRLKQNPCVSVHRPEKPQKRDRVLTNDEIKKFWAAASATREPFAQLLKLLLLSGARLNEVAGMRRSELSEECQTWTIPGSRTKNRRSHVVPLPQMARDILASVKTEGDIVFTTNNRTKVSGWSKTKRRLDAAMKIQAWRLHDLRRTVSTGMNDIGIPPHIVEAILNHARPGIEGNYNFALYAAEKREALERWAEHLTNLIGASQ